MSTKIQLPPHWAPKDRASASKLNRLADGMDVLRGGAPHSGRARDAGNRTLPPIRLRNTESSVTIPPYSFAEITDAHLDSTGGITFDVVEPTADSISAARVAITGVESIRPGSSAIGYGQFGYAPRLLRFTGFTPEIGDTVGTSENAFTAGENQNGFEVLGVIDEGGLSLLVVREVASSTVFFNDYVHVAEATPNANMYATKSLTAEHTAGADKRVLLWPQRPFTRPQYIDIMGAPGSPLSVISPGEWDLNVTRSILSELLVTAYFITAEWSLTTVTWNSIPALSGVTAAELGFSVSGSWVDTSGAGSDPQNITSLSLSFNGTSGLALRTALNPESWTDTYYGVLIRVEDLSRYQADGGNVEAGSFAAAGIFGVASGAGLSGVSMGPAWAP